MSATHLRATTQRLPDLSGGKTAVTPNHKSSLTALLAAMVSKPAAGCPNRRPLSEQPTTMGLIRSLTETSHAYQPPIDAASSPMVGKSPARTPATAGPARPDARLLPRAFSPAPLECPLSP